VRYFLDTEKTKPGSVMAYINSIVTFIDVLGFSDLLRSDPSGDRILRVASRLRQYATEDLDGRRASLQGTAIHFSDCVVRCTPLRGGEDPLPEILEELEDLTYVQGELLGEEILLRGGVAVGPAHIGPDGVLGPAVLDAYTIESKLAVYPRIVLHPELANRFSTEGDSGRGMYARDGLRLTRPSDDGFQFVDYLRNFPREIHTDPSPYREETARGYMAPRKELIEREFVRLKPLDPLRSRYAWLGRYHNDIAREVLGNEAADVIVAL
jgi:hypothetical protein